MVQYLADPSIAGFYNTIGAGATVVLSATQGGATGKVGDYLDSITATASAASTCAIIDGATTLATLTIPIGTNNIFIRAYSKSGAWSITMGATSGAIAVGKFS